MSATRKTPWVMLLLALFALVLPGCRRTPDEAKVREAITAMAQAAEEGSARGVGASLSEDFDGNGGELDRQRLLGMIRLLALRGEKVGVTMGPVAIEPRGERMVASFTVTLSSCSGGLLPERMGLYRVESAWRVEDGSWRCYTASWHRAM